MKRRLKFNGVIIFVTLVLLIMFPKLFMRKEESDTKLFLLFTLSQTLNNLCLALLMFRGFRKAELVMNELEIFQDPQGEPADLLRVLLRLGESERQYCMLQDP